MRTINRFILALLLSPAVFAGTLHVPRDYPTIRQAVDAAKTGDVILVAPGTYMENVEINGMDVTLKSTDGAAVTVIDAMGTGSAIVISNDMGGRPVVEGFTITNGSGNPFFAGFVIGGGISVEDASAQLTNLVIRDNCAERGGGVSCTGSHEVILENCLIMENRALTVVSPGYGGGVHAINSDLTVRDCTMDRNFSGFMGGGLDVHCSVKAHIQNCRIRDNRAYSIHGCRGGGLHASAPDLLIEGNLISGNTSRDGGGVHFYEGILRNNVIIDNLASYGEGSSFHGYGGGVICEGVNATIEGNLFTGNTARSQGGALFIVAGGPMLKNNVFLDNVAEGSLHAGETQGGGGVYLNYLGTGLPPVRFVNCLFHGNRAGQRGGGLYVGNGSRALITHCTFAGNRAPEGGEAFASYSAGITAWNSILRGEARQAVASSNRIPDIRYSNVKGWTLGAQNIDVDPGFVNPEIGDFHLRYDSRCRDTGHPGAPDLPECDHEGDPRIAGGKPDMGADEFHTHLYGTDHAAPGDVARVVFTDLPGAGPVTLLAGSTLRDRPVHLNANGDWYLGFPLLLELNLGAVPSPDGVLELMARVPASLPGPMVIPLQGLVGAKLTNPHVLQVD